MGTLVSSRTNGYVLDNEAKEISATTTANNKAMAKDEESSSHSTIFRNYFFVLFIVLAAVIIKIARANRGISSQAIFCLISLVRERPTSDDASVVVMGTFQGFRHKNQGTECL